MKIGHIALRSFGLLAAAAAAHSFASPPASITDKGSVTQKSASVTNPNGKTSSETVKINGLQGGKVINKGNKLIVQGGTIVAKRNQTQPMIQIENPQNKEILIENTQIIADNVNQTSKDGSAGIIVMEIGKKQGNTHAKVKVRNVHVNAVNATVTAKSSDGEKACAGIVCTGFDEDDKVKGNVIVDIRGNNTFKVESLK